MDVHVAGELVESLTEVGPDSPEQAQGEAPPTSDQDVPDAGEQTFHFLSVTQLVIIVQKIHQSYEFNFNIEVVVE